MSPEVAFSLLFIAGGAAVLLIQPAAWPGAGMLLLTGLWGLWDVVQTARLRRKHGTGAR